MRSTGPGWVTRNWRRETWVEPSMSSLTRLRRAALEEEVGVEGPVVGSDLGGVEASRDAVEGVDVGVLAGESLEVGAGEAAGDAAAVVGDGECILPGVEDGGV